MWGLIMETKNYAYVLAGVCLEVADYIPDKNNNITRAEWRSNTLNKAIEIIDALNITIDTDDIDEIVINYLSKKEALS
jgi:flagellin-specific chaperone FliS